MSAAAIWKDKRSRKGGCHCTYLLLRADGNAQRRKGNPICALEHTASPTEECLNLQIAPEGQNGERKSETVVMEKK